MTAAITSFHNQGIEHINNFVSSGINILSINTDENADSGFLSKLAQTALKVVQFVIGIIPALTANLIAGIVSGISKILNCCSVASTTDATEDAVAQQPTDAAGAQQPTDAAGAQQPTDAAVEEQPTDATVEEQPKADAGAQQPNGEANPQETSSNVGGSAILSKKKD
jgi:hypothetical protein